MTEPIHTSVHGCVFCELPMWERHPGDDAILNIEPLNPVVPGHRIFIPRTHALDAATSPRITGRVFAEAALWGRMKEVDFNLITNAGRAATQNEEKPSSSAATASSTVSR